MRVCVLMGKAFPKHYPSNPAALRGALPAEPYITRGVVSRPNLSQRTIPLPGFMFCPRRKQERPNTPAGRCTELGERNLKHKRFSEAMEYCSCGCTFGSVDICVGKDYHTVCALCAEIKGLRETAQRLSVQKCSLQLSKTFKCGRIFYDGLKQTLSYLCLENGTKQFK